MLKDNCNAQTLFYIGIDSLSKAIATDGLANLGIAFYTGDNKKILPSVGAGTLGYIIRTISRQCIDENYEFDILDTAIKPYYLGGMIGGAFKYGIKNLIENWQQNKEVLHLTRDIVLGSFNGIGSEISNDFKMHGIQNLTIALVSLKLIESQMRQDNLPSMAKSATGGFFAALGMEYIYKPIKNESSAYAEQILNKMYEVYSEIYFLGISMSYDEYI